MSKLFSMHNKRICQKMKCKFMLCDSHKNTEFHLSVKEVVYNQLFQTTQYKHTWTKQALKCNPWKELKTLKMYTQIKKMHSDTCN